MLLLKKKRAVIGQFDLYKLLIGLESQCKRTLGQHGQCTVSPAKIQQISVAYQIIF